MDLRHKRRTGSPRRKSSSSRRGSRSPSRFSTTRLVRGGSSGCGSEASAVVGPGRYGIVTGSGLWAPPPNRPGAAREGVAGALRGLVWSPVHPPLLPQASCRLGARVRSSLTGQCTAGADRWLTAHPAEAMEVRPEGPAGSRASTPAAKRQWQETGNYGRAATRRAGPPRPQPGRAPGAGPCGAEACTRHWSHWSQNRMASTQFPADPTPGWPRRGMRPRAAR
jgi:hypothetical protein